MAAAIGDIESAAVATENSPNIDEVLYSLRQPPYTYSDMREFLESEFNSENIDFWGNVEEYRQRFEKAKAPKQVRVAEPGSMQNQQDAAKLILDTYIAAGSEKEVNISGTQRSAVVKALGPEGGGAGVKSFSPGGSLAQREILFRHIFSLSFPQITTPAIFSSPGLYFPER